MGYAAVIEECETHEASAASRDEQHYRCDVCKAAPGVRFFDRQWACFECRQAIDSRLRREAYAPGPCFQLPPKRR